MSRSQKQQKVRNKVRIGVNHSEIEVQIIQIIGMIVGRKLRIEDLVGTREIIRQAGSVGYIQVFRGMMSLRSLETNFQFCLRNTPRLGTFVIISESLAWESRGVKCFFRSHGRRAFEEVRLSWTRYIDQDLWGGRVPESAQTEYDRHSHEYHE